ncbi:MAG: BPSS1780 family membrane protein [Gammaproteobacteria bacterium]
MSSLSVNPYRPPSATVADVREPRAATRFSVPAAKVGAGRGANWIGEGWSLFKAAPWMWIVALLILAGIQIVLALIPFFGDLVNMLIGPIFMVGLLTFAHGIAQGEEADIGKLFVGFKDKPGTLIAVGALYIVMIVAVIAGGAIVAVPLLGGAGLFNSASPEQAMQTLMEGVGVAGVLISFLAIFALTLLAVAAYWFAPGLVLYADMGAVAAMKQSFSACLRNWLPFLVYGILALLVILLGGLALVIGLFVALPVLMASYYATFRDLFGRKS